MSSTANYKNKIQPENVYFYPMLRKKIVFLGSKPVGYHCFAHLLSVKDELNIEVTGLLTNTRKEFSGENDLHPLASQHGIPVLQHEDDMPECDIIYSVQ